MLNLPKSWEDTWMPTKNACSISVCMVAYDEEEMIEGAIKSTVGLADEVVVVDTGSTDDTIAVAKRCGAKVIGGADRWHKGEARNQSLDASSGDWQIQLDCDERIADPKAVREFLETTDADAVYIRMVYMDGGMTFSPIRCWRKGTRRFRFRSHETPMPQRAGKEVRTELVWEHHQRHREWKLDYQLKCLLMDVEENPDEPRPKFYLGRQYQYLKRWQDAINVLIEYLENPDHDEPNAWEELATCYENLNDKKHQIAALYQAAAADPLRRDWWVKIAEIYHAQGEDAAAVGLLRCALEIPKPKTTYVWNKWYGSHIHDLLARCLWKLGRKQEGYNEAAIAVALAPDDRRLRDNFEWFKKEDK